MDQYTQGRPASRVRQGQRLGRHDHVVQWRKPIRPSWMSRKLHRSLPEALSISQLKVEASQKGFRCRHLLLVTTLLEAEAYPTQELATGSPISED